MELLRIWEIIRRRKWIVLLVFLVFLAAVVAGTHFARPMYEAKAKILLADASQTVSTLMSSLGLTARTAKAAPATDETYDTEIALATIKPLLEQLVSQLNLQDRNGQPLKAKQLADSSVFGKIRGLPSLSVEQYEDSDILDIVSNSADPCQAAAMSNSLAELYIGDTLKQTRKQYGAAREFIEDQIRQVQQKYYDALREKTDFMVAEQTIDLEKESRDLLDLITRLQNDCAESEIVVAEADEQIALITEKLSGKEYTSRQLIDQLESRLSDLMIDVSAKTAYLTAEDLDVKQLNRQIETLNKILAQRAQVIIGAEQISVAPIYEALLTDLKNAYVNRSTHQVRCTLLNRHIDKAKADLIRVPAKAMRQSELELSLSVSQDSYRNLLEYRTQIGVAESMTLSNIKLIEPAEQPDEPDFPSKGLNYALGVFLGLFFGLCLAFFIDYVDRTVKVPDDIEDSQYTFLGAIPEFRKFKRKLLVSRTDPNDPIYEAYRKVIASIRFAAPDAPPKKLLISGIGPKTGCSATLVNLGIVLAQQSRSVLLVDTDLRRPSLHRFFGCSNDVGLTDVLEKSAARYAAIQQSQIENLSILPSGPTPADTGLLLQSASLKELIAELEVTYDVLIFDSAPLLIKNDAVLLMNNLDELIVVARSRLTTHNSISKAAALLAAASIKPLGLVLNCT